MDNKNNSVYQGMQNFSKKYAFPLLFFFVFLYFSKNVAILVELIQSVPFIRSVSEAAWSSSLKIGSWLIMAYIINNLIIFIIWENLFYRKSKKSAPTLVKQAVGFLVYFVVFASSINVILGLKVSDIITTSGFIGLVIGFALRPILTDYFAGIAMNLEASFSISDWVMVKQKGIQGTVVGCVKEISWRTTKIVTPEKNCVVIPNSELLLSSVTNLSKPSPASEFEFEIRVDYNTDTELAQKVLDGALCEAVSNGGPMAEPAPKARIRDIDAAGICFKITYMVDPIKTSKGNARHLIYRAVIKHFQMSGITPAAPKQEVFLEQNQKQQHFDYKSLEHKKLIVSKVDFFKDSNEEELSLLAENINLREPEAAEAIIEKGASGDSMFIVIIGSLDVYINNPDEPDHKVASLHPGDIFGEMSLLTGAARSATIKSAVPSVLYEISKDTIAKLFKMRPEFMDIITRVCVERQFKNKNIQSKAVEEEKSTFLDKISQGIRSFFHWE